MAGLNKFSHGIAKSGDLTMRHPDYRGALFSGIIWPRQLRCYQSSLEMFLFVIFKAIII